VRVHAIQTGRLVGNETVMRGEGWSSLFHRRRPYEFPALSFLLEHPEGPIMIDTGLSTRASVPRGQRLMGAPAPVIRPEEEIEPRMRAKGLAPDDVRRVVITHLDWDHTGGLGTFPNAEVLVHRPEYEFASKLLGRLRYQPKLWPASFDPTVYDLDPEPVGPFPASKSVTASGDVRLVPIAGHSIAQVGVVVETDGPRLLFAADHVLRQDWFVEDSAAGNLVGLGALFFPKQAIETSRRVHAFVEESPTVLLPSHDSETPARLEARHPLRSPG
jgi:glyoxylase-like metal-dependent hydrolase (beta-lactamase superfamily II)